MDRTNEYKTILKLMQNERHLSGNNVRDRRGAGYGINSRTKNGQDQRADHINFMRASKAVFNDLSLAFSKLERLNELAKKKTIFDSDESSSQLNELVSSIKQDVNSLNRQIEEIRQYQIAKSKDFGKQNVDSYSKNVVLNLQEQLATMSNDFKSTLELRTQNMQQQKLRREQFTSSSSIAPLPPKRNNTIIDFGDDPDTRSQMESQLSQRQPAQQQQTLLYGNVSNQYVEERASTMQTIESTIVELGGIFNQLATMVHQQDEMITRIDTNITDTNMNVEAAHESLLRYFQSVSNNRWLMFKVFGVLFFFFLLFVTLV